MKSVSKRLKEAVRTSASPVEPSAYPGSNPGALPPLDPTVKDISWITECGLTQKLSRPIRCF
jgi:hypothetical protein